MGRVDELRPMSSKHKVASRQDHASDARCGTWIQDGGVLPTACHQLHSARDIASAINVLRRLIPMHPRALVDLLLTYPRFRGTIKPQLLGRADAELHARTRSLSTASRALKCPVGKRVLVVAPHPDDETIGPRGFLLRHVDWPSCTS